MTTLLATLGGRMGFKVAPHLAPQAIESLAMSHTARPNDLTIDINSVAGLPSAWVSEAAAVITSLESDDPRAIQVKDVLHCCARLQTWLPIRRNRLINPRAVIHSRASVASSAEIGDNVAVGEGSQIAAGAVLGDGVVVGAYSQIGCRSVLATGCQVGNRVSIGAGCSIGEDGFAFVRDGQRWLRMPVFGGVTIGDDCTILAHVVIHAGVFGDTRIGDGCALDSQVLIGHDSCLDRDTAIAGNTAVAGAARIGKACRIGGKVGIGEGVSIADDVTVTAMSMVSRSLLEVGMHYSSGFPAEQSSRWWRRVAEWRRTGRDLSAKG